MAVIDPVVRHMLLCDEVQADADNPRKINLFGLVSTIRASAAEDFPLRQAELCVYLQLCEVRGTGKGRVVAVDAETAEPVFASREHDIREGNSPLDVLGFTFRLRECVFPRPALYLIQFRYNGKVLAQQPLLVR
jgi:hypothetical protein